MVFKHELPAVGVIDVELGPPAVQLCLEYASEFNKVFFYLNLTQGKFTYKPTIQSSDLESVDIKDWKIAFTVSFDERALTEPPASHPDMVSQWKRLEPGKYGLN